MNETDELKACVDIDDDGSSCGECKFCNSIRIRTRLNTIQMSNDHIDRLMTDAYQDLGYYDEE